MASRTNLRLTIANDTTVAWAELGKGPPLVLLHGLGDSHRTWHFVAPLLAQRFRVLAPDLPGHGFSARPEAPYTPMWYANTIVSWMDAIGVERAHFCGHSFGGGVALWMLIEHARRIDRLALVSAGGLGREVGFALRVGGLRCASPFLAPRLLAAGTRFLMPRASRSFAMRGAKEIARLAKLNGFPNTGLAFRRTLSACVSARGQRVQSWRSLYDFESLPPMGLFWGGCDSVLPVKHAHEVKRRLADVTLHVYPRSGHFVHLEEPNQVARDLTRFLAAPETSNRSDRRPSDPLPRPRASSPRLRSRFPSQLPAVAFDDA